MQSLFPRALAAALPFEFPLVRVMAAGLLYEADSRFEDILTEAFEDENFALRAQAAYVVGASEIIKFAPRLRELLDDPNPWIAANAMGALVRMRSPQAATRAVELLATAPEDREPSIAFFCSRSSPGARRTPRSSPSWSPSTSPSRGPPSSCGQHPAHQQAPGERR